MRALLILILAAAPLAAQNKTSLLQEAMAAEREGRIEDARGLLETLVAAEPSNAAARLQLRRVIERQTRAEAMRLALSRIILSAVRLEDVSAREAMDYLTQAISKSRPGFRLNTVWMVPPEHPGRVTLQLEDIPASEALRYAAEAAGLEISFEEHAVKVRAPGASLPPTEREPS